MQLRIARAKIWTQVVALLTQHSDQYEATQQILQLFAYV